MPMSILTSKGQTTIPKSIRELLHLKPRDRLIYVIDGDHVIVRPLHGNLQGLKGIFREAVRGPIDFKQLREGTKRVVGRTFREKMR